MIHIKRFIAKVAHMESKSGRDLIMPIADARGLRDELAAMLADNYKLLNEQPVVDPTIQVEIVGGKFK